MQKTDLWTRQRKERGQIERVALALYTTLCKIDNQLVAAVWPRELSLVFRDDLEEWGEGYMSTNS